MGNGIVHKLGLLLVSAFLMLAGPALASEENQPVLLIEGHADEGGAGIEYTLEALADLGERTLVTSTIWTQGEVEFSGIPLAHLLLALEVSDGQLELIARNDYMVEIPVDEALQSSALIAYRMNGELMSPRVKGPFWLVYPYDSDVKYQSETYYSKSIWQMERIVLHEQDNF